MTSRMRTVRVNQVPEKVTAIEEQSFLRELQEYVETERPRLVLDCSKVRQMDNATIHLLLSCLEEVMKRNGDVRLSSLRPAAEGTLRFSGIDRLFEMYTTTEGAVHSFSQGLTVGVPAFGLEDLNDDSEFAA